MIDEPLALLAEAFGQAPELKRVSAEKAVDPTYAADEDAIVCIPPIGQAPATTVALQAL